MLDLDGVVYVGADAVPGAPAHVAAARAAGMRVAFITNNASRPPDAVAEHLRELGVEADADDVVTSAQAAARVLAERLGAGRPGRGAGRRGADRGGGRGRAGAGAASRTTPTAVVTGYGPDVPLARHHAGRRADPGRAVVGRVQHRPDDPDAFGVAPGHGVLVETLRRFTGVEPVVAGKPARPLLDETVRRCGGERPLMVGDRLDTDIEGAHAAGVDSLLVMTGVTGLAELVAAGAGAAADLHRGRPGRAGRAAAGARGARTSAVVAGRLDGPGGRRGARGRRARGSRTTGGGWWPWPPGATSTTRGRAVGTDGVEPPG